MCCCCIQFTVQFRMSATSKNIKCVVVGDGDVGKSALLITFTTRTFPTEYLGVELLENYSAQFDFEYIPVNLDLWAVAGQEDYERLRPICYSKTDVFLVCFSVVSPDSFQNVQQIWIPEVRRHCINTPIILVGAKIDLLDDSDTLYRLNNQKITPVTKADGNQMAVQIGASAYIECSARRQYNLQKLFDETVRAVLYPQPVKSHKDCALM